ncbi:MAG: isochorismatase family cysteine hydrolase [Myxococcota bacterium]|jgi:ureidoacrylate peracid hydrolase
MKVPSDNPEADVIDKLRKTVKTRLKACDRPVHLFKIEPGRAALVLIDMQMFACSPTDGVSFPRMGRVIKNINRLAAECRKLRIPVIWVRQNITMNANRHNAGLYGRFHKPGALNDIANLGRGTQIAQGLAFDAGRDYEVFKNRYSAFLSHPPELENLLKRLGRDQLIVAGVAANVCVESTIRDAMQLDYEVVLVPDATTSFDAVLMEATLTNTRLFFGDVKRTVEVIREVKRHG